MPFHRLYTAIKKVTVPLILAGTILVGANYHKQIQKKIVSVEEKINSSSQNFETQIAQSDKKIISLEEKIQGLINEDKSKEYHALNSTVQVTAITQQGRFRVSSGSIIYSKINEQETFDNYVLGVAHSFSGADLASVVSNTAMINVQKYGGVGFDVIAQDSFAGEVVLYSENKGFALIHFESFEQLSAVKIANDSAVENLPIYSKIFTIGSPLGLTLVKTNGELQVKNIQGDKEFWMTTANVYGGNSGGGVYYSSSGELIGVIQSCGVQAINAEIALPVSHISFFTPTIGLREWLNKENFGFIVGGKIEDKK